jgi:hypothetical protein
MTTDIIQFEVSIDALTPASQMEELLELRAKVEQFTAAAKQVKAAIDQKMIDWIAVNGDIEIDTIRYYVGYDKKVSCKNKAETLEAIMNETAGDEDAIMGCFVSEPFKPGTVKTLVGNERYLQLFDIDTRPVLKDGKPARKKLKRVDSTFITKGASHDDADE